MHLQAIDRPTPTPTPIPPAPPVELLTVPGINGSGPSHWQSHWERLAHCRRVDLPDWSHPRLHDWVPALEAAIANAPGRVVLAAHSLGCLAVAWWAQLQRDASARTRVLGALLVAPPDVDATESDPRLRDFRPTPSLRLPFPSVVVASRNDRHARFERSSEIAKAWGSRLVDAGHAGHLNADSALGTWPAGLQLVAGLAGANASLLAVELALRTALS